MEIREVQAGDVLVLAPDGSLASSDDCATLESKLATVLKKGVRFVVVDCADVVQLRAPAIRALLQASRKLGRSEGRVVLCAMNAKVQRAFAISGFDHDFTVVPSREEAVRRALEAVATPSPRPRKTTPEPSPAPPADAAVAAPPVSGPQAAPKAAPPPKEPPVLAAPVAPVPPAEAPRVAAAVEEVRSPQVEALAAAVLAALGGGVHQDLPPSAGGAGPTDPNLVAGLILAALSARPA